MTQTKELTAQQLALYLGCEVEWMSEQGYFLAGINTRQSNFNPVGLVDGAENPFWANYDEVKPILRPASDMTEEERAGLLKYYEDGRAPIILDMAEITLNLASRGVDVLGLIRQGLAIDKTELK